MEGSFILKIVCYLLLIILKSATIQHFRVIASDNHSCWHPVWQVLSVNIIIMKKYIRLLRRNLKPLHLLHTFYSLIVITGLIYRLLK